MPARISTGRRAPRRALLVMLIATFFVPSTSHATPLLDTCAAAPNKESAFPMSLQANTCVGDTDFAADWFKFEFAAPTAFGLRFEKGGARAAFSGPSGPIAPSAPNGDTAEWHYRLPAGAYYLHIAQPTPSFDFVSVLVTQYSFDYRFVPQNDCNSFGDAGGDKNTAHELFLPTSCTGTVWGSEFNSSKYKDAEDWYKFNLNQGETVYAYVYGYADVTDGCGATAPELLGTGCSSDVLGIGGPSFELRNSAGAPIPEAPPGQGNLGVLQYAVPATGTYFLRISHTQDDLYSLSITTASIGVPDLGNIGLGGDSCASGGDASQSKAGASELFPSDFFPSACYGALGTPETDTQDWYKFNVSGAAAAPRMLTFQMDAATFSPTFEIRDPQNNVAGQGSSGLGIPGTSLAVPVTTDGVWTLRIDNGFGGAGNYEFTLDLRTGVGGVPSINPSLPPIGLNLLNDSCVQPGQTDAANSRTNAADIYSIPSTITPYCYGSLGINGDTADWFKFSANSGDRFSFMLTGDGSLDANLELYYGTTTTPFQSYTMPGLTPDYTFQTPLDRTGTWYVRVFGASANQSGTYAMLHDARGELINGIGVPSNLPTVVPTLPNIGVNVLTDDCFGTGDASNDRRYARKVSNQTACQGTLAMDPPSDTYDWYSFDGTAGMQVIVGVSGDGNLDTNLTLFQPNGQRVVNYQNSSPVPDYIRHDMTQTGLYKVAITRANPTGGRYGLFVDVPQLSGGIPFVPSSIPAAPSLTGDCGQAGDAPNRTQRDIRKQPARDYNPNNACMGSLGGTDREDWYQFGGTSGQHLHLGLSSNYSLDADVWLIDPQGIWRLKSANGGLTPESVYNFVLDKTGTWKIRVAAAFGSGDYGLSSSLSNY